MSATLKTLGATGTVTGSKHLLTFKNFNLLIDCGLYQGLKEDVLKNWDSLNTDVSKIDAIIITHAHLDHTGYLPKLIRDGFHGKIYATSITCELTEIILKDSAEIQMSDAHKAASKNRKHPTAKPLYNSNDISFTMKHFHHLDLETPLELGPFTIKLYHAGHIPGAVSAGVKWDGGSLLFSGDLGRDDDILSAPPKIEDAYESIMLESTYGGINHPISAQIHDLSNVLESITKSHGILLIPSFSMARSQILIAYLKEIFEAKPELAMPVYLNSPMSFAINEVFIRNRDHIKMNLKEVISDFPQLHICDEHWKAKKLYESSEPKIIISASGMLTGGRVMKHFELLAPDKKNVIFLPGYQGIGTLGYKLLQGEKEFLVNQVEIKVSAQVIQSQAFSAHADENGLISWLNPSKKTLKDLYLVHGEEDHIEALRKRISKKYPSVKVHIPKLNSEYIIN
jgi:metallo-beta-lactamase family protein